MPWFIAAVPAMVTAAGASGATLGSVGAAGLTAAGGWTGLATGVLSSAGSLVSAGSSFLGGQYGKSAANYNAAMLQRQANQTRAAGAERASQQALSDSRSIAAGTAGFAGSGIDPLSGSALSVMHENIRQAQATSMWTRTTANLDANNLDEQANIAKQEGRQQAAAGLAGGLTTFLGSFKSPLVQ
jgi:hypothetical protein